MAPPHNRIRRVRVISRLLGSRLDASRCARCRKKLHHSGAKARRAMGSREAIRCLDCRLAYCPACARKHFAPVQVRRGKLMAAVVDAAVKAMRETAGSCQFQSIATRRKH